MNATNKTSVSRDPYTHTPAGLVNVSFTHDYATPITHQHKRNRLKGFIKTASAIALFAAFWPTVGAYIWMGHAISTSDLDLGFYSSLSRFESEISPTVSTVGASYSELTSASRSPFLSLGDRAFYSDPLLLSGVLNQGGE